MNATSLRTLQTNIRTDQTSSSQLLQFAISTLFPASVRRQLTDEYTPNHRTLFKRVSIEFDVDQRNEREFLAVSFPHKGTLQDDMVLRDAQGQRLSALSYREYRVLAAKTLRLLLNAAYGTRRLPPAALHAEALALKEIVRFERYERHASETSSTKVLNALRALRLPYRNPAGPVYLGMAIDLVNKLSERYVVVVAVPVTGKRVLVHFERTEIPSFHREKGRVKSLFRMMVGSRPVQLNVSARNAVTCRSYHLYVRAPDYLYLGEVDTKPIEALISTWRQAGRDAFIRVRPRRGQSYFHLYGRLLKTSETKNMGATVKFFEVPPGSIGKSAIAAVAACLVVLAVGAVVTWAPTVADVDTQIVAFLLAVPGIAAAWLGLESRQGALFDGSLTARLSLLATFLISLGASTLMLLMHSGILRMNPKHVLVLLEADLAWTILALVSVAHAVYVCCVWWHRARYYRMLMTKPGDNSASMLSD
nr:hypothetical protein [Kibdelosporangium sp. MJ126-NF4]